jgi:hypothetical protein
MAAGPRGMRRLAGLASNLALSVAALALLVVFCEAALRLFPCLLPRGTYGASHYRPDLMSSVYGDTVVYNKVRFVVREPNAEGFLDVEHALEKAPGIRRIGVFGDSYVEATQVPLEQVFHRRVEKKLGVERVEVLGFGMSGWGTLHSYLAFDQFAPRYGLDAAVYVFVENDLGDNALEIQGARAFRLSPKVYAMLSPWAPGYELVFTNPPDRLGAAFRVSKWFQENLLLARLAWSRASLFAQLGIALQSDEADREMMTRAREVPNQNDLPSTWPAPYAERARRLGEHILRRWRDRAQAEGCALFVLYVPRGEEQLRDPTVANDTWRVWLEATTRTLGLPLIDPSRALMRRLEAGDAVYDDHWSPAGHEVVAEVLANRLEMWLREGGGRTR